MGRVITVCQSGGFQAGTRHEAVVFGEEGLHHNRDQADEIRQGLAEIVEAGRLMGTHEEAIKVNRVLQQDEVEALR